MKLDELTRKRISELALKAKAIEDARSPDPYYSSTVNSEEFQSWATSVQNLLQRVFGEDSVHYRNFFERYEQFRGYFSEFTACRGIFLASKDDYEGGYLFDARTLIKADVFSDVLDQANELLASDYKDGACVIAGVVLETTLKELCTRHRISHSKLDRMNSDLCKAGAYNMGMQKQITAWAERRNKAAHGEWTEYNASDVEDMIRGVTRLIAEYL